VPARLLLLPLLKAVAGIGVAVQTVPASFHRMGRPSTGEGLAGELIEGNGASSGLSRDRTALDIGCGTGDSSIYLARHGWQVTGVDFVSAALAKARKKADVQRVAIDFL
jgi:2-polyprenyl-3-methyl-5-hydroxy-6-metoxy-1,4-benzoquinol methylase